MPAPVWEERVELAQRFAPHLVLFPKVPSLSRPGRQVDRNAASLDGSGTLGRGRPVVNLRLRVLVSTTRVDRVPDCGFEPIEPSASAAQPGRSGGPE